jgi:xanthine dehydrogenase YagR molybdenum-binding subunit
MDVVGQLAVVDMADAVKALKAADITVDHVYHTPQYNHNAFEPHATSADLSEDGDQLLVFDGTSNLYSVRNALATIFDLKPKRVRVVSPFVGGSIGGKGTMWWGTVLCIAAAKAVKRPVCLALSREGIFRAVGIHSLTEQRIALGARLSGKLLSLIHTGISAVTKHGGLEESFFSLARQIRQALGQVSSQLVKLVLNPKIALG